MIQPNRFLYSALLIGSLLLNACDEEDGPSSALREMEFEDPASFQEVASLKLGGEGAAEISAFDPASQKLFVVNNADGSKVDVVDLSDPTNPAVGQSIDASGLGGGVNSVAVKNGVLALAVENDDKQANGMIVLFDVASLSEVTRVTAGALPDMVTFSPDGNYILVANEGEPDDDYEVDPVGSISIVDVNNGYTVTTLGFEAFQSEMPALMEQGLRVFGPNASLMQDLEPEYITVSDDSQTAWVAIQENNALARVDIASKRITDLFPFGFKDYSLPANAIDVSNKDDVVQFKPWSGVVGMYQPDAIEYFTIGGTSYIISANEGDARDYDGFSEEERVDDLDLDPAIFPNAEELQKDEVLGRLKITTTLGDIDGDGDYDKLYSYGARSFSIWNGETGEQLYDSGNEVEMMVVNNSERYDDGRSDDKGVEPEGVTVGMIDGAPIGFIGLERVDIVLVYDLSNPMAPQFLQLLEVGDAPEGVLFVSKEDSPNGKSMLIVSSEDDGMVKVFQPSIIKQ